MQKLLNFNYTYFPHYRRNRRAGRSESTNIPIRLENKYVRSQRAWQFCIVVSSTRFADTFDQVSTMGGVCVWIKLNLLSNNPKVSRENPKLNSLTDLTNKLQAQIYH